MEKDEYLQNITEKIPEELVTYGLLFTAANRIQAAGDRIMDELTLRQQFLLVLLSLFDDYPPNLQELATVFGSSYQNVKRMAAALEEKDYLRIRKDRADRRKIRIDLNREKYELMRGERYRTAEAFSEKLYSGISEEEIKTLNAILRKIDDNLAEMEKD